MRKLRKWLRRGSRRWLWATACIPFLCCVVAWMVGLGGPRLLWDGDGEHRGFCDCESAWPAFRSPGATIRGDDWISLFWGGWTAEDGAVDIAVGPEGLAIAQCIAPGSPYGGYVTAQLLVPHWILLSGGLLASLIALVLMTGCAEIVRAARRHAAIRRRGRCRQCGYLLRGLAERRCPECG